MATDSPGSPQENPVPTAAHLTVVGQVYHQMASGEAAAVAVNYGRMLTTDEQPYIRHTKVPGWWVPLDVGWLDGTSQVTVENTEGKHFSVIPTQGELALVMSRRVEVGVPGPGGVITPVIVVRPKESVNFTPHDVKQLLIRCTAGEAKCVITAFPL